MTEVWLCNTPQVARRRKRPSVPATTSVGSNLTPWSLRGSHPCAGDGDPFLITSSSSSSVTFNRLKSDRLAEYVPFALGGNRNTQPEPLKNRRKGQSRCGSAKRRIPALERATLSVGCSTRLAASSSRGISPKPQVLVVYYRTTSASTVPCTPRRTCCPTYCPNPQPSQRQSGLRESASQS